MWQLPLRQFSRRGLSGTSPPRYGGRKKLLNGLKVLVCRPHAFWHIFPLICAESGTDPATPVQPVASLMVCSLSTIVRMLTARAAHATAESVGSGFEKAARSASYPWADAGGRAAACYRVPCLQRKDDIYPDRRANMRSRRLRAMSAVMALRALPALCPAVHWSSIAVAGFFSCC